MKAAPLISLGLSVVLGAGAILVGRAFMAGEGSVTAAEAAPAQVAMTGIYVAASTVEAGAVVGPDALRLMDWPANAVPEGAVTDLSVLGERAFARGLIVRGEPLLLPKIDTRGTTLTLAASIRPGMRAVSIIVRNDTGVAGFVLPGDRVDIHEFVSHDSAAAGQGDARASETVAARPVLRNVRVLAVDQIFESGLEGARPANTVTFEVTPEDALQLSAANQRAALGLALVGRDEPETVAQVEAPRPRPQTRPVRRAPRAATAPVRVINGSQDTVVTAPVARPNQE